MRKARECYRAIMLRHCYSHTEKTKIDLGKTKCPANNKIYSFLQQF